MIYDYSTNIVQDSLSQLKIENYRKREKYVNKLLDYYNGNNTTEYIKSKFDLDAFREVPAYESNITKKFINKMSRIYTVGADRNVSKRYDQLATLKDAKMKHIERITRLIGTIAVRVMFVDGEIPHFDYQPIYYFHPFFGDDPFKPVAISYALMNYTDDVTNTDNLQYIHWNDTSYTIFDNNGRTIEEKKIAKLASKD